MIKKLIHTSDWHLKPYEDVKDFNHKKFLNAIDALLKSVDAQVGHLSREEVLFIIVGDLFDHREKEPSNISMKIMAEVLKRISDKYQTIITIGNHDYDRDNRSTLDCISPIMKMFELHGNTNIQFYKESQCFVKDNIIFCNYSNYEDNKRPEIEAHQEKYPNKKSIGLVHDVVTGAINGFNQDVSILTHNAIPINNFIGCDFVLMGDIHKHQTLYYNSGENKAVYSGSLFQLNYGESVGGHGYCLWDVETESFEFHEIDTGYGMYKLTINSFEDTIKDIEFTNL